MVRADPPARAAQTTSALRGPDQNTLSLRARGGFEDAPRRAMPRSPRRITLCLCSPISSTPFPLFAAQVRLDHPR